MCHFDWALFVEALGEIAWPLVVFIAILIFRENLNAALQRVSKVSVSSVSLDFAEEAKALDSAVSATQKAIGAPEGTQTDTTHDLRNSEAQKRLDEGRAIAHDSPQAALVMARMALEATLFEKYGRENGTGTGAVRRRRPSLNELHNSMDDELTRETSVQVRRAIALANAAAHGEAGHISGNDALAFLDTVEKIILEIDAIPDKKDSIH